MEIQWIDLKTLELQLPEALAEWVENKTNEECPSAEECCGHGSRAEQ